MFKDLKSNSVYKCSGCILTMKWRMSLTQLMYTGVGFDSILVLISLETGRGVPYPCSKCIDLVSEVKLLCWLNFSTPSFCNKIPPQIFCSQPTSRWSNAECFTLKQVKYPKILLPSTKSYSAQTAAPPSQNASYQLLICCRIAKLVLFFDGMIGFRPDCRMNSALTSVLSSTFWQQPPKIKR